MSAARGRAWQHAGATLVRLATLAALSSPAALLTMTLAQPSSAQASDAEPPPEYSAMKEARERFQRGVRFYREGNNDAALAEFVRAQELAPNFRILYNLGQVQAERNDAVAALRFFKQYLEEGGALVSPERKVEVERTLLELSEKVAEIQVEADAPGARLFLDDVFYGELPLAKPLTINAGKCNLRLEREGYTSVSRELVIASGELRVVSLTLVPEAKPEPPAPAPPPPPVPSPTWDERPFWISLAATASLGTATAAFAFATAFTDQPPLSEDPDRARAAQGRMRTYALLTGSCGAATLVSAGAAAYFLLSRPSEPSKDDARVTAKVVPSPSGVYLLGTF